MSDFQDTDRVLDDMDYGPGFNIHFIKESFLGRGSFGTCVSAIHKSSNQRVAVKIMDKRVLKNHHYEVLEKEGSVLRQLSHPNIIKVLNKIDTTTHLYFVMELAEGGDLRKFIRQRNEQGSPLKEGEVSVIMQKIFLAVQYIHTLDDHLENILIQNPDDITSIKLCDFGLCGQADIDHYEISKTFYIRCGTRCYMAPEMFTTYKYNEAVDLFSCGIVMFNMLLGNRPRYFDKTDDPDTFLEKLDYLEDNIPMEFSKPAKHLILRLCKTKPTERYNVKEALKHPWITRNPGDEIPLTAPEQIKQISQAHIFSRIIKAGILLALIRGTTPEKEKIENKTPMITNPDVLPRMKREKISLKNLHFEPGKLLQSPSKKNIRMGNFKLDIPHREYLSIPSIPTECNNSSNENRSNMGSVPPLAPLTNTSIDEVSISPKKKFILKKTSMNDFGDEMPPFPGPKTPNDGFRIHPVKAGTYSVQKRDFSEIKLKPEKTKSGTPLRKILVKKVESDDKPSVAEISTTNDSFSPPVSSYSPTKHHTFESPKKASNYLEVPKAFRLLPLEQEDEIPRTLKPSASSKKLNKNPSTKSIGSANMLPNINVGVDAHVYPESTVGGDFLAPPNLKPLASSKNGINSHSNISFNTLVSSSRSSRNNNIPGHKVTGSLIPFDVKSQISESRKNLKFNQMIVSLSNFKVK